MREVFVLWQPVLFKDESGRFRLNAVLSQTMQEIPVETIELPEAILARLQLKGSIVGWKLEPCLCDYITPPEDLDQEEDRWSRGWFISIEIGDAAPEELRLKNESLFLLDGRLGVYGKAASEHPLPYLVMADFADEKDRSAWLNFVTKTLPSDSYRIELVSFSGQNFTVWQARLLIGPKHLSLIAGIEKECAKREGFVNFNRRIEEAEEVYNPDGVD